MQTDDKLVRLEKAEGFFDVDPVAVSAIEPCMDGPANWSVVTMADGHQAVVKGSSDQVQRMLRRTM